MSNSIHEEMTTEMFCQIFPIVQEIVDCVKSSQINLWVDMYYMTQNYSHVNLCEGMQNTFSLFAHQYTFVGQSN